MKKFYVYIHTCPNGKKYVGVTGRDPESRWKEGKGYCQNEHFYRAILKYGWSNFQHEVFEVDSKEEMYRKEIELISFYHSNDPKFGYNNSVGGEKGALGCKRSEEYRKHRSEAQKKKWTDLEYKEKMSEANKKSHLDPEYRRKQSEAHKGKILSEEHRKHIAESHKGKPLSDEHKRRITEAKKGKPLSEETKRRMSEAKKGKPKPKVKIKLPDGTLVEITKNNLVKDYVNKGRKFEYVS